YGTLGLGWLATLQVVDLDAATLTATASAKENDNMTSNSFRPVAMALALALCGLVFAGCTTTSPSDRTDAASTKASLDSQVDATLIRLYNQVPGAREIGATAKGLLV